MRETCLRRADDSHTHLIFLSLPLSRSASLGSARLVSGAGRGKIRRTHGRALRVPGRRTAALRRLASTSFSPAGLRALLRRRRGPRSPGRRHLIEIKYRVLICGSAATAAAGLEPLPGRRVPRPAQYNQADRRCPSERERERWSVDAATFDAERFTPRSTRGRDGPSRRQRYSLATGVVKFRDIFLVPKYFAHNFCSPRNRQ